MSLFRKNRPKDSGKDRSNEISVLFHLVLRRFSAPLAAALGRAEQKMTVRQKKVAVSAFCLVTGIFFMSILCHALYDKGSCGPSPLKIPAISIPVSPQLPDSLQERLRRPRHARLPVGIMPPDSIIK